MITLGDIFSLISEGDWPDLRLLIVGQFENIEFALHR